MIESFADKETEKIAAGDISRKLPWDIQRRAGVKLDQLAAAAVIDDLRIPAGNRLERLSGDLAAFWSIRINDQWRIVFRWENAAAHEVQITDYH